MRLKLSYRICLLFVLAPYIESRYPDVVYSIKYSFGVDAYTSINALFTSGKYSFHTLQKKNDQFAATYKKAQKRIKELIPTFQQRRNSMFCHCNEKQSEEYINDILLKFDSIFNVLANLHSDAMRIFCIDNSEIRAITSNKFNELDNQLSNFSQGLQEISMNRFHDELNDIMWQK